MLADFLNNSLADLAIKFGFLTSIILGLAAIYAFFFKETASVYQTHYECKLRICADAALTVAQIANVNQSEDLEDLKKALRRFDELYYGHLILFESRKLASQMVAFRSLFVDKDEDLDVAKVLKRKQTNGHLVRQKALKVASQCRAEVRPTIFGLIYDRLLPVRQ